MTPAPFMAFQLDTSGTVKLSEAQMTWLRAFEAGPPEEMAWLDANHCDVHGPPETWIWLTAWWPDGRSVSIHTDDREGLAPFFDGGSWTLTEAGRTALSPEGKVICEEVKS